MTAPITVDLPHRVGQEEARRRIADNVGSIARQIPGGASVDSQWQGDRLALGVGALGQQVSATIDVEETFVRVSVVLPPALSFFGGAIEGALRAKGPELLEDRSRKG